MKLLAILVLLVGCGCNASPEYRAAVHADNQKVAEALGLNTRQSQEEAAKEYAKAIVDEIGPKIAALAAQRDASVALNMELLHTIADIRKSPCNADAVIRRHEKTIKLLVDAIK